MARDKFKLIDRSGYAVTTSVKLRPYIKSCLDVYRWNEKVTGGKVINKLLEDFLRKEGYMDDNGNIIKQRII